MRKLFLFSLATGSFLLTTTGIASAALASPPGQPTGFMAAGSATTCALRADSTIWSAGARTRTDRDVVCWGNNFSGQATVPEDL